MARSLPERTVDAYFAVAVTARFPSASLWDPTNTPGSWDHKAVLAGKTILVESKANEEGNNDIEVDLPQLNAYLSSDVAPLVFYLFADPPGWSDWRDPVAPGPPATKWPSFPQWAYVTPAAALASATGLTGQSRTVRPNAGTFDVLVERTSVPVTRLDHFFNELEECFWVKRHPRRGASIKPGEAGPSNPEAPIGNIPAVERRNVDQLAIHEGHSDLLTAIAVHLAL